jgi:hypothetical protein
MMNSSVSEAGHDAGSSQNEILFIRGKEAIGDLPLWQPGPRRAQYQSLAAAGWRVLIIWECVTYFLSRSLTTRS